MKQALATAKEVLKIEAKTLSKMASGLGSAFERAIKAMATCKGRIILTGMGKPGFIARKIAATLASTGTPSFYLHPAEAIHGDLGMITGKDLVIAISDSGETEEIVRLVSSIKRMRVKLIALTSNKKSTLAQHSEIVLDLGVSREACPLNLAPSASTTAALAMGDALALTLLKIKGFKPVDFAMRHPGGSLGRKLLLVGDIMRKGKQNPIVRETQTVREALLEITRARAGSCTIVNRYGKLQGIFTDGDFRRHAEKDAAGLLEKPVKKFSTKRPQSICEDDMAVDALQILKTKKVDELPVMDKKGRVVGLLDIQDLLKAGFV